MKVREWLAVMTLAGITLGGCDWFEDPTPESVHVTIDGAPGDSLRVITSTVFVAAEDEIGNTTVTALVADTSNWILPVDEIFDIREDQRFFIQAFPGDSASTVPVDARVQVDGRSPFVTDVDLTITQPLQFLFLFNQRIATDFRLL